MLNLLDDVWSPDIILIDGMNLAKRNHHGRLILQDCNGLPMGAPHGCMEYIFYTEKRYPKAKIIFLWEGDDCFRKDIYPEYKANRPKKEDGPFSDSVKILRDCLKYHGILQLGHYGIEADDLAGYYVTKFPEKNILTVSKDHDWWQYLTPNESVRVEYGETTYTYKDVKKILGIPPESIPLFKALTGDQSDNIKGIPLFPHKIAKALCNKSSKTSVCTRRALYDLSGASSKVCDKWWGKLMDCYLSVVVFNCALTKYDHSRVKEECIRGINPEYDGDRLRDIFLDHGLQKLLKLYDLNPDI